MKRVRAATQRMRKMSTHQRVAAVYVKLIELSRLSPHVGARRSPFDVVEAHINKLHDLYVCEHGSTG